MSDDIDQLLIEIRDELRAMRTRPTEAEPTNREPVVAAQSECELEPSLEEALVGLRDAVNRLNELVRAERPEHPSSHA